MKTRRRDDTTHGFLNRTQPRDKSTSRRRSVVRESVGRDSARHNDHNGISNTEKNSRSSTERLFVLISSERRIRVCAFCPNTITENFQNGLQVTSCWLSPTAPTVSFLDTNRKQRRCNKSPAEHLQTASRHRGNVSSR